MIVVFIRSESLMEKTSGAFYGAVWEKGEDYKHTMQLLHLH
jgi:hypothetical protein